eukprot:1439741-Rhodomonas_salina.2
MDTTLEQNRASFNLREFTEATGLGAPSSVMFFTVCTAPPCIAFASPGLTAAYDAVSARASESVFKWLCLLVVITLRTLHSACVTAATMVRCDTDAR